MICCDRNYNDQISMHKTDNYFMESMATEILKQTVYRRSNIRGNTLIVNLDFQLSSLFCHTNLYIYTYIYLYTNTHIYII